MSAYRTHMAVGYDGSRPLQRFPARSGYEADFFGKSRWYHAFASLGCARGLFLFFEPTLTVPKSFLRLKNTDI
ncbi:MAG: hypothetical protein J6Q85_04320 [Clostridia bacterium]|nr:hypothetical protein [Clostridia bacterium]